MATRPSRDKSTVQVAFRLPAAWLAEADRLADELSTDERRCSRTDALREAIRRGLSIAADKPKAKKPKAVR